MSGLKKAAKWAAGGIPYTTAVIGLETADNLTNPWVGKGVKWILDKAGIKPPPVPTMVMLFLRDLSLAAHTVFGYALGEDLRDWTRKKIGG